MILQFSINNNKTELATEHFASITYCAKGFTFALTQRQRVTCGSWHGNVAHVTKEMSFLLSSNLNLKTYSITGNFSNMFETAWVYKSTFSVVNLIKSKH